MREIIFITGGARSGKSTFGETKAIEKYSSYQEKNGIAYIATAEPLDEEFKKRIEFHRQRRDSIFQTYEEALDIDILFEKITMRHVVIIIECISTWLGNIFFHIDKSERYDYIQFKIGNILNLLQKADNKTIIIVSNEVGMGIVPADEETRLYRDIQGQINQKLSSAASEVYFTVSGIPVRIK
jgi:adenosylcobinamide kinase / adenosylcobinamide-phosphate guanylyltransferase